MKTATNDRMKSSGVEGPTEILKVESPLGEALRMFVRSSSGVAGFVLIFLIVVLVTAGPFVYKVDPFDMVWMPFAPPGEEGGPLLGTDQLGRDILAGIINGGRATLAVGGAAALLTCAIGILVGALAGYYAGWVDALLGRITEFFQVLPPLLFAMVIVVVFPPTLPTVAFAIGVVSWPNVARLTRAEFLRLKNQEFVTASRASGAYNRTLIWSVILPNVLPPLVIAATLNIATAILFEAGLSFLGLSDPNVMSWGLIIGNGREHFFSAWWIVTFPGIAIFLASLATSLIGDGLNEALNPKLRQR
jgi:peptide/nickel transport system permease protein